METIKPDPVESTHQLRERMSGLLRDSKRKHGSNSKKQMALGLDREAAASSSIPKDDLNDFVGFVADLVPDGGVYLFGGVIRDIALFGKRGFESDIDLVVDGDWSRVVGYLDSIGAERNKFGGYRLSIDNWPVDIWSAEKTWAIENEIVVYRGIASLTETTILNWDAILMNWKTGNFVFREGYFEQLKERILDVVMRENPNPLGMAVRVFRHLCLKDAKGITLTAAEYLSECTRLYRFEEINAAERRSYREAVVDYRLYRFFERLADVERSDLRNQWSLVSRVVEQELELE